MIGVGRGTLEELKERLDYIQVHSKSLTEQRLRPFTKAVTNELVQLKNLERKVDNVTVWVDSLTQTILQATELQKVIVSIGHDVSAEYGVTPVKEVIGKFLGIVDVTLERVDSQATSFGKARDVWKDARESVEREWKNLTPKCIVLSQQYKGLISTAKPLVVKAIDDWSVKTFSDLTSQLEKITGLVGRVIGSQQALNDIEKNASSVPESLQKLPAELNQLIDKIVRLRQDVASAQLSSTLAECCSSLETLSRSYSDWLAEIEQLHGRWLREANSWLSIAKREATSLTSKLAGKIEEAKKFVIRQDRIGKLTTLCLDIEALFDQLRKELRKKLTPEQVRLLEILTDLEAKTGSINLTDVEESFGKLEANHLSDLLVLSKKKLISFRLSTKEESVGI
jgi:prefoldin subunit 5